MLVALSILGLNVADHIRSAKRGGAWVGRRASVKDRRVWPTKGDQDKCTKRCHYPWLCFAGSAIERVGGVGPHGAIAEDIPNAAPPTPCQTASETETSRCLSQKALCSLGDSTGASTDTLRRLTIASIVSKAFGARAAMRATPALARNVMSRRCINGHRLAAIAMKPQMYCRPVMRRYRWRRCTRRPFVMSVAHFVAELRVAKITVRLTIANNLATPLHCIESLLSRQHRNFPALHACVRCMVTL